MNEEKLNAQIKRAKKANYTAAVISLVILLILALALLRFLVFQKDNPRLMPEGIAAVFKESETVYIESDGLYYECSGGEAFLTVLAAGTWVETKDFYGQTQPYIRIHIAEQYEIYVYPDGRINTYDGYAGTKQKSNEYYMCDIYNALKAYAADKGIIADFTF